MKKAIWLAFILDIGLIVRSVMTVFNHQVVINDSRKTLAIIIFWAAVVVVILFNREVWHRVRYEQATGQGFTLLLLASVVLTITTLGVQPQRRPRATMQTISIEQAWATVHRATTQMTNNDVPTPIYFYSVTNQQATKVTDQMNRIMTEDDQIVKCRLVGQTAREKQLVKKIRQTAKIKSAYAFTLFYGDKTLDTVNHVQTETGIQYVMQDIRDQ